MKKLIDKIKCIKLGHILYGLSVVALIYFIYTMYLSFDYINNMVRQGQVSYSANISEIIRYLVENCSMSLFYTVSFCVYGYLCTHIHTLIAKSCGKDMRLTEHVNGDMEKDMSSCSTEELETEVINDEVNLSEPSE